MNKLLAFFCIAVLSFSTFGQSKKVWLEYADEYFHKADYISALKYYQLTINDTLLLATQVIPYEVSITGQKLKDKKKDQDSSDFVPVSEYIPHQIAVCYQKIYDYPKAVENFSKNLDERALC